MAKEAVTPKTLADMPEHIRMSAWCNRREISTWARFVDWLEEKLGLAAFVLTGFSCWVFVYWMIAALPVDFITNGIPAMTKFIVITYAVTFGLNIAAHWIGIQAKVPRADKSYPVLGDPVATGTFGWLGLSTAAFAIALVVASIFKTHGAVTHWDHASPAVAMSVLAGASLWLRWHPLTYGYTVPTEAEVDASWHIRMARHQREMQPRSGEGVPQVEDDATPISPKKARFGFDGLDGMHSVKDKLIAPAKTIVAERHTGAEDPGNGLLLHGEPGNGKTVFAEALAGELDVPFLQMTYGDVSSKWVGEMPRVIANCFALAKRTAPCVFFVDELDSFLVSRDSGSNNAEDQKITNTLLTEIVELRKHRVVLIGATNYIAKLDAAAIREGRFDYKVEITPPDEAARIGLLQKGFKKHAPLLVAQPDDLVSVAKRWNGFSVSRLQAVVKAMPRYAADKGVVNITYADWMGALREVQGRNGRVPPHTKSLSDLVLDPQTREAVEMVAARLKDVARIEAMGGTLPTGVLFYGPSGTGKTAVARALAKECGWAFLSVAGPDLVADRDKLSKVHAEAKDLRPTLIFIDEADDLLRARHMSSTPDLTNRLLVLMDGADERVKDVVFIAATNHPQDIDPALLRAGRFTEKVGFTPPAAEAIPRFVSEWLKAKKIGLEPGFDAFDIARMLDGQTIANIEGTLQYALNRAIHRHSGHGALTLTEDDVNTAVGVIVAET
ncbi:MAG: ATP-binding protein [Burkholderiaceae bacterium]|nr:ATP-binding protein [Burkholderiaceae bacterium]